MKGFNCKLNGYSSTDHRIALSIVTTCIGIILIVFFSGFSKGLQGNDIIYWSKNKKLKLTDFKKTSTWMGDVAGRIDSYIIMKKNKIKDTTILEIYAIFSKAGSYVTSISNGTYGKDSAFDNWDVVQDIYKKGLIHEQGHFDITEIFARKLTKFIVDNKLNLSKIIHKEYLQDFNNECIKYQSKYDKATNYCRNQAEQKIWVDSLIPHQLKALDQYYNREIKFVNNQQI